MTDDFEIFFVILVSLAVTLFIFILPFSLIKSVDNKYESETVGIAVEKTVEADILLEEEILSDDSEIKESIVLYETDEYGYVK